MWGLDVRYERMCVLFERDFSFSFAIRDQFGFAERAAPARLGLVLYPDCHTVYESVRPDV